MIGSNRSRKGASMSLVEHAADIGGLEATFTYCFCGRHGVDIVQADPRIRVSADLLDEIRAGECGPCVTLNGDVLRIQGSNRQVVYRIGDKVPHLDAYEAEWPD